MSNDTGVIRSISWRDFCPWLIIFRGFSLALNPNIILLAFAGLLLSAFSWFIADKLFLRSVKDELSKQQTEQAVALERVLIGNQSTYRRADPSPFEGVADPGEAMSWGSNKGIPGVFWDYADSFHYLFNYKAAESLDVENRTKLFAYFLFGGLATIAIWSILAGAITRIAVLRLAREEGCGLVDAVKFALERFLAYFTGPVLPMAFVLVLGLVVGVFCLFMMADWGVVLVGILWVLVLAVGFLMAFLLIGLLFGWPLMWPTISAENSDAFDAISRCYAYVMQRPLHYLFYMTVSIVFGALCWWVVNLFGEQVIAMADWAASWGAGSNRISEIYGGMQGETTGGGANATLKSGGGLIHFWNGVLRTAVTAYAYGLFWCMASAVYLLLRKDVDETEFDEVYVEGEDDYGLPPLTSESSAATDTTSSKTETKSNSDDSEDVATVAADEIKKEKKAKKDKKAKKSKSDDE